VNIRGLKIPYFLFIILLILTSGCATTESRKISGEGDEFEGNDQIFSAAEITLGSTIEATINPAGDKDFFRVYTRGLHQTEAITVSVKNQSENLYIQLIFFDENRQRISSSSAPTRGTPQIDSYFMADPNKTYYIAVFSGEQPYIGHVDEQESTKPYSLTVSARR
jgi:hypothetical protein